MQPIISVTNSPVPTGHSSNLGSVSFGASGMYNFYCFNGYIYKIVSDDNDRILVYDKSDVSAKPIGNVYNPLYSDNNNTETVYSVNNISNAVGTSAPQSIAIEFINPVIPIADYYYQRADYFASDISVYEGQTYQIAPIFIGGILTSETEAPYEVDKKIGETTTGFDVYSYKNPQSSGALAIDIPGMTCDFGDMKLYPMAIPAGATVKNYSAMYFLNDNTGWLCETALNTPYAASPSQLSAQLLKTTDGGNTWTQIWNAPSDSIDYTQLDFVSDQTGWAVEMEGTDISLAKTIDGGKNWSKQLDGNTDINSLQFFDTHNGYIRQDDKIFKTSDGGSTWTDITPPTNNSPYGEYGYGIGTPYFCFLNPDIGWATGNLSGIAVVYYTDDEGKNWTKLWSIKGDQNNFLSGSCFWITFCNASDGWILLSGEDLVSGSLYRTTDGGMSFQKVNDFISDGRPLPMKLYFTDKSTGWIPTVHGAGWTVNGLMHTTDGGKTFDYIYISPDQYGECDCDDVIFTSQNIGFAFSGEHGCGSYIAGTTNGGKTWNLLR